MPWLSRHTARLGVEDVCAYFADGLEASRKEHLATRGIPTVREFIEGEDVSLRIIHAVVPVADGDFGTVKDIDITNATATLIDEDGRRVDATCDVNFLRK